MDELLDVECASGVLQLKCLLSGERLDDPAKGLECLHLEQCKCAHMPACYTLTP